MSNVPKRELGETINYAIAAYKQDIEVDKIFTATPTDANGWLAAFIERAIAHHMGTALREAGEQPPRQADWIAEVVRHIGHNPQNRDDTGGHLSLTDDELREAIEIYAPDAVRTLTVTPQTEADDKIGKALTTWAFTSNPADIIEIRRVAFAEDIQGETALPDDWFVTFDGQLGVLFRPVGRSRLCVVTRNDGMPAEIIELENYEPVTLSPAAQLAANLAKLPAKAFVKNTIVADGPHGRPPVLGLTRGESGYNPVYTDLTADELNEAEGVTQAQARAMYNGSLFGFDTASADPDNKFNNSDTKES